MGDWRLYYLHRDRVEKVTPADVQRVAAKYLTASNRTVGYFIPSAVPQLATVPATPDVTALVRDYQGRPPVPTVPDFDYHLANVESKTTRSKLAGGIKVALLPKPTRDEQVTLMLTLRYGNEENLKGMRTAAELLPDLMERGTKRLSFEQLQDEKTRLDVQIGGSGSLGTLTWSARARRSTLKETLDLLREILREPALAADGLAVIKPEKLASLEERLVDPQFLASNLRNRQLSPYPAGDVRRIETLDEQITNLKAVTLDQIRKLHAEYVSGAAGELTIVGDFDPATTLAAVGQFLNDWKAQQPYARIATKAFLDVAGGKQSIRTPDKANAVYASGLTLALTDQDPDYAPLLIGDFIFGSGGFASRLGDRIRQKEGLSYGVFSGLSAGMEDRVGRLTVGAICNPENIGKVEAAVREEFQKFAAAGIPDDEFKQSREGLLKERERSRSSDLGIARLIHQRLRLDQTLKYEEDLDKRLSALTSAEVLAAWKRHIDEKRLVIVVAGDFPAAGGAAKAPGSGR
jgi:zinc protease